MRPYPFPLDAVGDSSLGGLLSSQQSNPIYYSSNKEVLEIVIKNLISKDSTYLTLHDAKEMTSIRLRIPNRRHRRFSVRLRLSRKYLGSVVTLSAPLAFRVSNGTLSVIGPVSVLQTLRFRLSEARRSWKNSRRPWVARVKGVRPSPEEDIGMIPRWRMDGGTFTSQGTSNTIAYHRDYTSVNTPDFKKLAISHRLPINSHHVLLYRRFDRGYLDQREALDNPPASTAVFRSYLEQIGASDTGPNKLGISHNTQQRNKAISRLGDAIRGETSNLAESVATLGLTFDMIGNTIRRINGTVIALKRLNFPLALQTLFHSTAPRFRRGGKLSNTQSLANNWLELQYGWKPLLADIQYAVKSIGNLVIQDRSVGSARASATFEISDGGVLRPNAGSSSPDAGYWYKRTRTTTKFVVRFKVGDPLRAFMSQSGFTNPISLGWELLPFSFVVDWFLPIGSYLESIDSWGGLEFLDGCETTFTRDEVGYQRFYYGQSWLGSYQPTLLWTERGALFQYGILLDRVKLNALPSPRLPSLKNPFSFEHTLNGLALMRQLFK